MSSDEMQSSTEETYEEEVYYPLVDNVLNSLKRSNALKVHKPVQGFLGNITQLPGKEDLKHNCLDLKRYFTEKQPKCVISTALNPLFATLMGPGQNQNKKKVG